MARQPVRRQLANHRARPVGVATEWSADLGGTGSHRRLLPRYDTHTLPPLGFTVDEALTVMVALGALATSPFRDSATSALRKVVAVTDDRSLRETADLAARIHLLGDEKPTEAPSGLAAALRTGQVLRISYTDRDGFATERDVEPMGFVGKGDNWYLIAWCRLRDGLRAFRGDRIVRAEPLIERAPRRTLRAEDLGIVEGRLRAVGLGENTP
jgi:predicted DNA-binding transcriptional regulator YafY